MQDFPDYTAVKLIGQGAFGSVYKAVPKNEPSKTVAIKVEPYNADSQLEYELKIYKKLQDVDGFPHIYDYRRQGKNHMVVMDYLGPTLGELFEFCGNRFSLKTTLLIAVQVILRIEMLHEAGYVHRDIKPDNFLVGTGRDKNRIFMIDLGLAKSYIDPVTNEHVPYKTNSCFTGTYRFSSVRNHRGIEQSRRDDLESIGYMLLFFLKGRLPWQGLTGATRSVRAKQIYEMKKRIPLDELCSDCPREFYLYMKYCKRLGYDEKPNYELLRRLFVSLYARKNFDDYVYDWTIVVKIKNQLSKETQLSRLRTIHEEDKVHTHTRVKSPKDTTTR